MRTFAIGDLHGCFTALQTLEREMAFTDEDVLITLGDYVDRGPDTKSVVDWLIARRGRGGGLIALKGNHELMMLWSLNDPVAQKSWMNTFVGGNATLKSYGDDLVAARLVDVPEAHLHFLENETVSYHETDTHLFVHASVLPQMPMSEQPDEVLFWERFQDQALHLSGKPLICGHTAQHDGMPVAKAHGICIDTRAYGGGWLTCLDMASGVFTQANQQGEFRAMGRIEGWLGV